MEIEAKFAISEVKTFQRLQAADQLAEFVLSAHQVKQVRDTYLDTADQLILAAGYAYRQREQEEGILITLKGLGSAEGAVHRREELETLLPAAAPPAEWPASPVRERVLRLTGDAPLLPLFSLQQTRVVRQMKRGKQTVAELSLDDVHLTIAGEEHAYLELEVELASKGAEKNLATIVACLQDEWGLEPEPRSKFERALALLEDRLLTSQERAICQRIAERDGADGLRASALLALDEGATQAETGERTERTARTVRRWLAAFRQDRLSIFPDDVLGEAQPAAELEEPPHPPAARPDHPARSDRPTRKKPLKEPGLEAGDSMTEAARKTFYFHFQRMLYHEPGTRRGKDIEELHDMRVATRRMRAAFRVFGAHLDMKQLKPIVKDLRRTGRALGAVRDLDVFWEKTERYLDALPPEQHGDLSPLREVWEAEREQARERMLAHLDSERYAQFKKRFEEFLEHPDAAALPVFSKKGEPLPNQLRHVAPVIVYQRMASVQAYDEWVSGPDVPLERLHRLRIAAKRLRYTLEFFREVLGPEAKGLIKEMKNLQDHLGDLQDAVVASNLLRDFLTWGTWGHAQDGKKMPALPSEPIIAPGVAAYLAARQSEIQCLLDTFPQVWAYFQSHDFNRLVALTVALL
ncbi:MAG: CHAD domain-containing protein [Chloroflexota bacterium]|nr:CHAD domain-containing protein [Chloroflexota bacterium]